MLTVGFVPGKFPGQDKTCIFSSTLGDFGDLRKFFENDSYAGKKYILFIPYT